MQTLELFEAALCQSLRVDIQMEMGRMEGKKQLAELLARGGRKIPTMRIEMFSQTQPRHP
jgi:hypothetical protein